MWQKARIIKTGADEADKKLLGLTLWVMAGPPAMYENLKYHDVHGKQGTVEAIRCHKTNLLAPSGARIEVNADRVELLTEFAETVKYLQL